MHVLVIPSWYPSHEYPGNGIFFCQQVRALKARGLKVGVVAPVQFAAVHLPAELWRTRRMTIRDDDGVPTYGSYTCGWFPGWRRMNLQLWLNRARPLVERYVADHGRPDVVHAHVATQAGLLATEIHRKHGVPFVLSEHASLYQQERIARWQAPMLREAFAAAAARTVVSPALGEAVERCIGEAARPWTWVPNLVERPFFEQPIRRREPGQPFTFLHVASLFAIKGQEDLLRAFASSFRGDANTRLRIGGSGPMADSLRRLSAELGIELQVNFLGWLSREQVLAEMIASDAFVLSSHSETFGIVLAEALACGKPVVATACGGPECIVNEGNGLLADVGDVQGLGKAMRELRDQRDRYDDEAIRADCAARFGEDAVMESMVALLHEAAQSSV